MEGCLLEKKTDQVPWTIRQTFLGILITLVPLILLDIGLNSLGGRSTPIRPLKPQVDFTAALITLIFSSLIEGAFLIAPLYFANRAFRSMAAHTKAAFQALGFRGFRTG